jgi:hypothetical protein
MGLLAVLMVDQSVDCCARGSLRGRSSRWETTVDALGDEANAASDASTHSYPLFVCVLGMPVHEDRREKRPQATEKLRIERRRRRFNHCIKYISEDFSGLYYC